jgi:hypothetical protein
MDTVSLAEGVIYGSNNGSPAGVIAGVNIMAGRRIESCGFRP